MLANIKFLKDNSYITTNEYKDLKSWILYNEIYNEDYFESLSCWMIEGLITKEEYIDYIKEVWGVDLKYNNKVTFINVQRPVFNSYTYSIDSRISIISIILFLITIIVVLWMKSVII